MSTTTTTTTRDRGDILLWPHRMGPIRWTAGRSAFITGIMKSVRAAHTAQTTDQARLMLVGRCLAVLQLCTTNSLLAPCIAAPVRLRPRPQRPSMQLRQSVSSQTVNFHAHIYSAKISACPRGDFVASFRYFNEIGSAYVCISRWSVDLFTIQTYTEPVPLNMETRHEIYAHVRIYYRP